MNVLVFGAGGFLGSHVVHELQRQDRYHIFAAVRSAGTAAFDTERTTVLEGDLLDPDYVRDAVKDKDVVIFTAGRTWSPGLDVSEYGRINVGITKIFFEVIKDRPDLRVVFTSSTATVGGTAKPVVLDEQDARGGVVEDGLNPYDYAKIECEEIALRHSAQGGNVVILNPGILLGPSAIPGAKLPAPLVVLLVCLQKCPFYVNARVAFSDVRDVADAHVKAIEHGQSGCRYLVVSHNLYRRDFYTRLTELTGTPRPWRLPHQVVTMSSVFTDTLSLVTKGIVKSPVHRHFARTQKLHYCGDSQRAINEIGFNATPIEDTIIDTVRQYVELDMLPDRYRILKHAGTSNTIPLVCLYQMALRHPRRRFLLPQFQKIYQTCRSNQNLDAALTTLAANSSVRYSTGRYRLGQRKHRHEMEVIDRFFDY
ncbi:MAG: NAD-dependent epimerase/dehydratase family protein, partial [Planctomycetales bacterium]